MLASLDLELLLDLLDAQSLGLLACGGGSSFYIAERGTLFLLSPDLIFILSLLVPPFYSLVFVSTVFSKDLVASVVVSLLSGHALPVLLVSASTPIIII